MEYKMTEQLIGDIMHKLPGQIFAIKRMVRQWTDKERERLENELHYLTKQYTMDEIVDGYLFFTQSVMEETKYFLENGDYRCHSFDEVNRYLYANEEHMKWYMLGLAIAEYFWSTILNIHRFYSEVIQNVSGERYLEIGPGHGKYFLEAYKLQKFREYDAVDISETAIQMTGDYIAMYRGGGYSNCNLYCADATKLSLDRTYDFVVIQEVLEHIENPQGMLKKIREILTCRGLVYALFPINAPSPAHIYLFHSISHVKEIISTAGFEIVREKYIIAKGSLADAEKFKRPIDACFVLKKMNR